jgi:DNA-binding MarR family transcriptional regulator
MNTALRPRSPDEPDPSTAAAAISGPIRLWQAVAAAHAALTLELDADGGACPVLAADTFAVLLSLADEPGYQLRMHELAERSHLTPSGLTRRVDRLESDGLLARVGCPGDRRGAFAQLTPRGLDELWRALPHHAAVLERYVGPRLDDPEIDGLVALLGDLAGSPRPERTAPASAMTRGHPDPRTTGTTDRSR